MRRGRFGIKIFNIKVKILPLTSLLPSRFNSSSFFPATDTQSVRASALTRDRARCVCLCVHACFRVSIEICSDIMTVWVVRGDKKSVGSIIRQEWPNNLRDVRSFAVVDRESTAGWLSQIGTHLSWLHGGNRVQNLQRSCRFGVVVLCCVAFFFLFPDPPFSPVPLHLPTCSVQHQYLEKAKLRQ